MKVRKMASEKRLLVLVIDVDDDLGEKTGVRGPVTGRKGVFEAASKLAVADPEEVDANAMFKAVKVFDELSKENQVQLACVTGSRRLGYAADREIVKQLEKVLHEFKPEACVFVSDGASDEQILPLVQSRVKIDSVHAVYVKQQKDLEKTYFVILDKLREPHFARVVFGVPGLALLLYFLVGAAGIRYFVGLLGAYLMLKGVGVEDWLAHSLSQTRFSLDRVGSVFYLGAVPLALVSIGIGLSRASASGETEVVKLAAIFAKEQVLLAISLLLVVVGRGLEAYGEKRKYLYPAYITSSAAIVLVWLLLSSAADWVIGTISFSDFFITLLLVVLVMFLVITLAREFKKNIISKLQLEGREVYTELGSLLGKIVGVNKKKDNFIIQTESGQKFDLQFDHIVNLGEKVVIRY